MNRRRFILSVTAMFSMSAMPAFPALPSLSLSGASAAVAVPTRARSWAVYMSTLHGECTPQTLHAALNIPVNDAKRYITKLIADGVIKPNPIVNSTLSNIVKDKKDSLLEKVKERLEMKTEARFAEAELEAETVDELENAEEVELEVDPVPVKTKAGLDA